MSRPNKLIQFYLTNICNSHCRTCNIWKNKRQVEIPVNNVINIINQYPKADYVFGGGEFTLYTNRHKLLDYCDENDISYTVLSNAVNVSLLENLILAHNIKNLTISCDGIKHNEIRGVMNNLKGILYIVEKYKDKIPNLKISYTLSRFNQSVIDEDMKMFKEIGFDKVYFCIAQDMDLLKADKKVSPLKYYIEKMYNEYGDMLYDKDLQLLEDILFNGKLRKCDSTQSVHTIYTDGNVVRCQSKLSNVFIGNIFQDDFKSILEKDERLFESYNKEHSCPFEQECMLVCQRRYDYEDRV